jgi:hypothetical protein
VWPIQATVSASYNHSSTPLGLVYLGQERKQCPKDMYSSKSSTDHKPGLAILNYTRFHEVDALTLLFSAARMTDFGPAGSAFVK